jgi:hypothetical protein
MRRMSGGTTPTFEDASGFFAFDRPGYVKVAMGLSARPVAGRTELATETRVSTTDPASRQNFKLYWRVIRPGSALARCSWRRAVRLRAEQASTAGLGLVG